VGAVPAAGIRIGDGRSPAGNDVGEHTRGAVRRTAPARRISTGRPDERRGTANSGRIVTLFIGQGHGFIRLRSGREVFFHRSDVHDGTSFNAFAVGDAVTFELLEDHISGPRALRIEQQRSRRGKRVY
jgi:cold shock CspA family protein